MLFSPVFCATQKYTELLLTTDKLEVRYRLDSSKDAEILRSKVKNLADRQLHVVTISRLADVVSMQVIHTCKQKALNPSS